MRASVDFPSVSVRNLNFFTCQQGGPDAREIPDANALQYTSIKETVCSLPTCRQMFCTQTHPDNGHGLTEWLLKMVQATPNNSALIYDSVMCLGVGSISSDNHCGGVHVHPKCIFQDFQVCNGATRLIP